MLTNGTVDYTSPLAQEAAIHALVIYAWLLCNVRRHKNVYKGRRKMAKIKEYIFGIMIILPNV
jgi:hypothetical protein